MRFGRDSSVIASVHPLLCIFFAVRRRVFVEAQTEMSKRKKSDEKQV